MLFTVSNVGSATAAAIRVSFPTPPHLLTTQSTGDEKVGDKRTRALRLKSSDRTLPALRSNQSRGQFLHWHRDLYVRAFINEWIASGGFKSTP
jgi:hypothetical protein